MTVFYIISIVFLAGTIFYIGSLSRKSSDLEKTLKEYDEKRDNRNKIYEERLAGSRPSWRDRVRSKDKF